MPLGISKLRLTQLNEMPIVGKTERAQVYFAQSVVESNLNISHCHFQKYNFCQRVL